MSSLYVSTLLTHPDIGVNKKVQDEDTPLMCACDFESTSCVRLLLQDSRVNVNEHNEDGSSPLYCAAQEGHLDIIKLWIASGREMDLGKPGDVDKTDAIGVAKKNGKTEGVTLLE